MAPGKNHVTAILTEIIKYVRIHPNFASRPVWFEKMFLCCFSLKAGVLSSHPPPHCFLPCSMGFLISRVSKFSIFQEERSNWGGGGGVERDLQACLSSLFFLLLGINNRGTSFQITQVGSRSLGGFWHTWKFQSKWRLRGSCPEPFNSRSESSQLTTFFRPYSCVRVQSAIHLWFIFIGPDCRAILFRFLLILHTFRWHSVYGASTQ